MALESAIKDRPRATNWTALGPRRLRGWIYQAGLLTVLSLIAVFAIANLNDNLATRGLSLGFDFLWQQAGFGIGFSVISFAPTDTYWRVFLVGITNTLMAAGLGIVFSTILGFVIGIMRLAPVWSISRLALVYVELIRNLPLLLHVLIWYNLVVHTMPMPRRAFALADTAYLTNRGLYLPSYSLSHGGTVLVALGFAAVLTALWIFAARRHFDRTGRQWPVVMPTLALVIGLPLVTALLASSTIDVDVPRLTGFNFVGGFVVGPELVVLVAALTIYNASFIAELVRASIESVSRGQRDASAALGLRRGQMLRLVIIPQALRVLIPPLSSQYLHLLKASSLAIVIGYPDLVNVFTGTALSQTGRAVEIVLMTMAAYLVISGFIALASGICSHLTRITER